MDEPSELAAYFPLLKVEWPKNETFLSWNSVILIKTDPESAAADVKITFANTDGTIWAHSPLLSQLSQFFAKACEPFLSSGTGQY